MKKECELCKLPARVYCESDGASLCWNCDLKIHSANFLVAKHTRTLLCQTCQASTPWKASGANLGSTLLSVCHTCCANNPLQQNEQSGSSDDSESSHDAQNQVVPLTSTCSSSSQQSSNKFVNLLKRLRREDDDDDDLCSTSSSSEQHRPKDRRIQDLILSTESEKESDVLVNSLRKFHQQINTCENILG